MIVVKLMGGLGNQLFQYAAARTLALTHNTELKLDLTFLNSDPKDQHTKRNLELDVYDLNYDIATLTDLESILDQHRFKKVLTKYLPFGPPSYYIANEKGFEYDDKFQDYPKNSYLNGFWQSEKYFRAIREILLKEVTIKQEIPGNVTHIKQSILQSNSVSLHIRRGDYVTNKNAQAAHGNLDLSYYYQAMSYLNNLYEGLKVYVFSDDMDWVKSNLKLSNECIFVDFNHHNSNVFDMYLMSLCNHNIIANSSFSWWGAWLNQNKAKVVIAPKKMVYR